MDTIFARATAGGKSGVAVIRISGPAAFAAASSLAGDLPARRDMHVRILRDSDGQRLDDAVVLCFPGPGSFTGEDVVELQTHGSTPIVAAVIGQLANQPGCRAAEAGEFTRRALENGRLDLTEVEGLADLIDAETEAQRRQAMRIYSGSLGERTRDWRDKLLRAAALIEATIDFADEDVPVDVGPEVSDLLKTVEGELREQLSKFQSAERVREGFEVAIVGPPNAGKSTLLNAIAGRDAALTSEHAGTTRDIIEVKIDLDGLPVTFIDTAGLREAVDPVERMGVERAVQRAEGADLRLVLDPDVDRSEHDTDKIFHLRSKSEDLSDDTGRISALTGAGLKNLLKRIAAALQARTSEDALITRERHRASASEAHEYLLTAIQQVSDDAPPELIASELRRATASLGQLIGVIGVEDLLGEIFGSFCIGK